MPPPCPSTPYEPVTTPRCYRSSCTCAAGRMSAWICNGDDPIVLVVVFVLGIGVALGVAWASRAQERRRTGWEVD